MENALNSCFNCNKPLPEQAKFCGSCRTQVKCKECNTPLLQGDSGCIECGAEVIIRNETVNTNFNSISIHETPTERNIEAKFSDNVGKDLTGILRDAIIKNNIPRLEGGTLSTKNLEETEYQELPKSTDAHSNDASKSSTEETLTFKKNPSERLPLLTVAMRALPASEGEWILLYCYYASEFGEKPFTRADIIAKYKETNRWEDDKSKNLSSNIRLNVKAQRLNAFGEKYSILERGITLAEEILTRTKSTVLQSKSKKTKNNTDKSDEENPPVTKKKNAASGNRSKRLNNIDFYPEGKENLEVFFNKFITKNDYERVLLFVFYMKEIIEIQGVTYDHIYTCFETLDLKTPLNVPQITRNGASEKGWIDLTNSKDIVVTTNGRNKIRSWN